MLRKIKPTMTSAIWVMSPIILGVFIASVFLNNTNYKEKPQIANIKQVIEETPEIKDPDFVTLTFAGDIMLDRGVKNSVLKNFGGDYEKLFENLELLKESDIFFANLE